MQVFKAFFLSLRKQYKPTLIYILIFAIIETLMCSYMSKQTFGDFSKTKVLISVFDHDNTEESRALYDYLAENQNIVTIAEDKETMVDELFNRNVLYILTIKEGFSKDFTQLENVKQSDSSASYFIDKSIDQYLKVLDTYKSAGYATSDAIRMTKDSVSQEADVKIQSATGAKSTVSMTTAFFKYLPYVLFTIMITSLGSILCIFREKNISARIQCSSLSITKRNLQMALSCVVFGIIIMIAFIILGAVLCKAEYFHTTTLLCILNAFIYLLFSLAVTLLVSFFVRSDNILNLIANLVGLGLCFLGGVFVPVDILSNSVRAVGKFLPSYWYIMANSFANTYDGNVSQLSTYFGYIGIEALFVIAIFGLTLAASKARKTA